MLCSLVLPRFLCQPKFWTSPSDSHDAQGKRATQYVETPKVKMDNPPIFLKQNQKGNVQPFGSVHLEHDAKHRENNIQDPVVPLATNLHGDPLARLLWEGQKRKDPGSKWMEAKVPGWECFFVHREIGRFLSASADHIKKTREGEGHIRSNCCGKIDETDGF